MPEAPEVNHQPENEDRENSHFSGDQQFHQRNKDADEFMKKLKQPDQNSPDMEFSIDDFQIEPGVELHQGNVDEEVVFQRGLSRIRESLRAILRERKLTAEEQEQYEMMIGFQPMTQEFVNFIYEQGREE